jgi:predicted peptidase
MCYLCRWKNESERDMRIVVTFMVAALACLAAAAKGTITKHENEVAEGYNFLLYEPENVLHKSEEWLHESEILCEPENVSGKLPLIIALHGGSVCGADLDMVANCGAMDALNSGMELEAYVVAPQNNSRSDWSADRIMAFVSYLTEHYNVDTNRISAIGLSMGAYGVADLIAAYPDKIAAGIVLGGALAHGDAANLNKVPLWIIRGLKDREHAIARTEQTVKEMQAADPKTSRLIYSRVKGLGHRQHERALYVADCYNWLMSHSLADEGRAVQPAIEVKQLFKHEIRKKGNNVSKK